jgi:hypothetical protein
MHPRPYAALFMLLLTACATRDGADPSASALPPASVGPPEPLALTPDPPAAEEPEASDAAPPESPETDIPPMPEGITAAVASVHLINDCKAPLNTRIGQRSARRGPPGTLPPPGPAMAERCTQSTVQLSVTNNTDGEANIRVTTMRLVDTQSGQVIGRVAGRQPERWHDDGYQPWNERVAPRSTEKVAYKLGEPESSPGRPSPYAEAGPYVLEVELAIDGRKQTLRSHEFRRETLGMVIT